MSSWDDETVWARIGSYEAYTDTRHRTLGLMQAGRVNVGTFEGQA